MIIKLKKQKFKNSFKLALTKFVNVFIFVFELIFNITFTTITFNKIIEIFKVNFTINNNVILTINVFTLKTKSMINRKTLINEIITTHEIIIYNMREFENDHRLIFFL